MNQFDEIESYRTFEYNKGVIKKTEVSTIKDKKLKRRKKEKKDSTDINNKMRKKSSGMK